MNKWKALFLGALATSGALPSPKVDARTDTPGMHDAVSPSRKRAIEEKGRFVIQQILTGAGSREFERIHRNLTLLAKDASFWRGQKNEEDRKRMHLTLESFEQNVTRYREKEREAREKIQDRKKNAEGFFQAVLDDIIWNSPSDEIRVSPGIQRSHGLELLQQIQSVAVHLDSHYALRDGLRAEIDKSPSAAILSSLAELNRLYAEFFALDPAAQNRAIVEHLIGESLRIPLERGRRSN